MEPRGIIGNYIVERELGRGGMGVVYAAKHRVLGRPAAIKQLLANTIEHRDRVERFFNEARAAMAIEHPGIVEIYDVGIDNDRAFIAMELLDGRSLATHLARGPLPLRQAIDYARQITDALAAAHAAGVVHRDLKPDNIMVMNEGGRLKLVDFGIAKLAGPVSVRTATGAMIGTPLYMSPEQCEGVREIDARSDLYSLGCVMFAMLTGRPPFDGSGVISMHLTAPPPALRSRCPAASEALERVVAVLLAKSRDDRFRAARAVSAALAAPDVSVLSGPSHAAPTADVASSAAFGAQRNIAATASRVQLGMPAPQGVPASGTTASIDPQGAGMQPSSYPHAAPVSSATQPSIYPQPQPQPSIYPQQAPPLYHREPTLEPPVMVPSTAPPPTAAPVVPPRRGRLIAAIVASCAATAVIAIVATRSCASKPQQVASADAAVLADDTAVVATTADASTPTETPSGHAARDDAGITLSDFQIAQRTGSGSAVRKPDAKQPKQPVRDPRRGSADTQPTGEPRGSAVQEPTGEPIADVRPPPDTTPPRPRLELNERILFEPGDVTLTSGQSTLDKVAEIARADPTRKIIVTGHAETNEKGVLDALALGRANSVRMHLINRRIDRDRIVINPTRFITSPAGDGSTRRADITFAP